MATYAGRYSEDLQDRYGNAFRNAKVAVETLAGAAVTLYVDRDKTAYVPASGLAANEIKADDKGNLRFFADPGNYQIVVTPTGGSAQTPIPVSVFPDPLEPDASQSELDALEAAVTAEQSAREAGDALKADKAANLSDLADAPTARTNLGLGNVDNTADVDKPVSTAQAAALALKAETSQLPRFSVFQGAMDGTDQGAAFNTFLAAQQALGGGIVMVPNGVLGTTVTIQQPPNVAILFSAFNGAEIKALAGFTASNPLVRQGVANPTTADLAFGCRLDYGKVNCNGIANVGVFSEAVNENSGVFGCQVTHYLTKGIHYQSGGSVGPGLADNFAIKDSMLYCAMAAVSSVGIHIENGLSKNVIDNVTVARAAGAALQADAVLVEHLGGLLDELGRCSIEHLHAEDHANAVRCGTQAKVNGRDIEGRNCTRTIQIDATAGLCSFDGVAATGTTPTLVRDQQLNITVAPTNAAKKLLSHYSNRQQDATLLGHYLGEDLRLAGSASVRMASAGVVDWNGDTSLFRPVAGVLRTVDSYFSVQKATSGEPIVSGFVAGDITARAQLQMNGLNFGPGNAALDTRLYRSFAAGAPMATDKSFAVETVGQGFRVKEGTNAKMGTATLAAGSVVVPTTAVTANSRILLTSQADGGTPGFLRVSARTPGTSFTITSSSGTDTSTVAWMIVEPA